MCCRMSAQHRHNHHNHHNTNTLITVITTSYRINREESIHIHVLQGFSSTPSVAASKRQQPLYVSLPGGGASASSVPASVAGVQPKLSGSCGPQTLCGPTTMPCQVTPPACALPSPHAPCTTNLPMLGLSFSVLLLLRCVGMA